MYVEVRSIMIVKERLNRNLLVIIRIRFHGNLAQDLNGIYSD